MKTQLLFSALILLALRAAAPASAATWEVDCTGPIFTIQDAVDLSAPGDTIVVHPCTYSENVLITSKDGLHIVAAEAPAVVGAPVPPPAAWPTIDGGFTGPCLAIKDSDRVSVTGLRVQNCGGEGFKISSGSNFVRLHKNEILDVEGVGVRVNGSQAAVISSNVIENVLRGMMFHGTAKYSVAADNTLSTTLASSTIGIFAMPGLEHLEILRNEISGFQGAGIFDEGSETRISRNTVLGNCTMVSTCVCDQIILGNTSTLADLVGNEVAGGIDVCGATLMDFQDNF